MLVLILIGLACLLIEFSDESMMSFSKVVLRIGRIFLSDTLRLLSALGFYHISWSLSFKTNYLLLYLWLLQIPLK